MSHSARALAAIYVECDYVTIGYVEGDEACRTTDVRALYQGGRNKDAFWRQVRAKEKTVKGYK